MLIKRIKEKGVIKALYESTNVVASYYEDETHDLTIIFKNGGNYIYKNVKPTDYMRFETNDSQGKIFLSHIKSYPFDKGDKVDVIAIKQEIDAALSEEIVLFESELDVLLTDIQVVKKSIGEYSPSMLKLLKEKITKYFELKKID